MMQLTGYHCSHQIHVVVLQNLVLYFAPYLFTLIQLFIMGSLTFSWDSQVELLIKNPSANDGDLRNPGSIPGSGSSPGEGNGNPLQYSCLENPHGQRSRVDYSPWGCSVGHD